MVEAIGRGDASSATDLFSARIRHFISLGWSVEDHIRDR